MSALKVLFSTLSVVVILTACGGGGGNSVSPSANALSAAASSALASVTSTASSVRPSSAASSVNSSAIVVSSRSAQSTSIKSSSSNSSASKSSNSKSTSSQTMSSQSSTTSAQTSAAGFVRVPYQSLPITGSNATGGNLFLKDRSPGKNGELLGFGWHAGHLEAFKSTNQGDSWVLVDSSHLTSVGTDQLLSSVQDSTGKIHLLFKNTPNGSVDYARLSPVYTGAALVSFQPEVTGIAVSGSYNTNGDIRAVLQVVYDQSNTEVIVFEINETTSGGGFKVSMGKASISKPLSPSATNDFEKLDGSAGSTTVYTTAAFSNHDHSGRFAQLKANRSLWLFWGPLSAECASESPYPHTDAGRIELNASGPHTWSVQSTALMTGGFGEANDQIGFAQHVLAIYGTENFVWHLYFNKDKGLTVSRVNAAGVYTDSVVPSPDGLSERSGVGAMSVSSDEKRIWLSWISDPRGNCYSNDHLYEAFWNGKAWTLLSDGVTQDFSGMGGSSGWDDGLISVFTDNSNTIKVATLRGGDLAP